MSSWRCPPVVRLKRLPSTRGCSALLTFRSLLISWSRGGCWFEDGGLKVHLGVDPDFRPAKKAHAAFIVDDVRSISSAVAAAGVRREGRRAAGRVRPRSRDRSLRQPHRAHATRCVAGGMGQVPARRWRGFRSTVAVRYRVFGETTLDSHDTELFVTPDRRVVWKMVRAVRVKRLGSSTSRTNSARPNAPSRRASRAYGAIVQLQPRGRRPAAVVMFGGAVVYGLLLGVAGVTFNVTPLCFGIVVAAAAVAGLRSDRTPRDDRGGADRVGHRGVARAQRSPVPDHHAVQRRAASVLPSALRSAACSRTATASRRPPRPSRSCRVELRSTSRSTTHRCSAVGGSGRSRWSRGRRGNGGGRRAAAKRRQHDCPELGHRSGAR